jgi:predicted metal-dependent phosphoesterase TrpH
MKCDMHVHSIHSGMMPSPFFLRQLCRESYSPPEEVYETLKRRGMHLVTLTDHDSIDGGEALRSKPDFFLSEEVTVRMASGNGLHLAVYDLTERQHVEIQRRRNDVDSLLVYISEQGLFFSVNHAFSSLTGERAREDFHWFARHAPAFEIRNGHQLPASNRLAARLARQLNRVRLGGSDAHTVLSLGSAYTAVPGARNKKEFFEGLWKGRSRARGRSGSYWKLTGDALAVANSWMSQWRWGRLVAPFALLIPLFTFAHYCSEVSFAARWKEMAQEASCFGPDMLQSAAGGTLGGSSSPALSGPSARGGRINPPLHAAG